jgi:protein ImuA
MSRQEIVATLREHLRHWERSGRVETNAVRGSGCAAVDRLLPERGFPAGTLVEWLSAEQANGAGTVALVAARAAAEREGAIVVLDRRRTFYPPAAAALGLELKRVIVVRTRTVDDELWAFDQALRCSGVAAVWGAMDKLNRRWFRRLQLAAEAGGGIGHLLRPARVLGRSSWSYAQLLVEPRPGPKTKTTGGGRRWRIEITRCQGLARSRAVEVELDDLGTLRETIHETHAMPVASELAHSTNCRRSAGA